MPEADAAPRKRVAKQDEPEGFAEFWVVYPRVANQSKAEARRAWPAAVRKVGGRWALLVEAARRYAESKAGQDPHFIRHACRWLTGELWAAPPAEPKRDRLADRMAARFGPSSAAPRHDAPDPDAWRGAVIEGTAETVEPVAEPAGRPSRDAARELAEMGVPL